MQEKKQKNETDKPFYCKYRFINGTWRSFDFPCSLPDCLALFGFHFDDNVTYQLADNGTYSLKYRRIGDCVQLYINYSV